MLYVEKDETVNHRVRKCSKLSQKKYKIRHDLVGKKLYFDHSTKW